MKENVKSEEGGARALIGIFKKAKTPRKGINQTLIASAERFFSPQIHFR